MAQLQQLELEILELQNRLTLRPTLDLAIQIGERLSAAKSLLAHGRWLSWLSRMGLRHRTAQTYMQVANTPNSAYLPERLSIEGFLRIVRRSRRRAWQEEMAQNRQAAIDADVPMDRRCRVIHADCRQYKWPSEISTIACDPPWRDVEAYRWLGTFAASSLRLGGLLLAQCGTADIPLVLDALREAGLTYQTLLVIVLERGTSPVVLQPFVRNYRPIVVFSRGTWDRKSAPVMSDVYRVSAGCDKSYHRWQQPLEPWKYWLSGLTLPGDLIADPFAGSGTIGVAVKLLGEGRRYIATDIDADHVKVARHRLVEEVE